MWLRSGFGCVPLVQSVSRRREGVLIENYAVTKLMDGDGWRRERERTPCRALLIELNMQKAGSDY